MKKIMEEVHYTKKTKKPGFQILNLHQNGHFFPCFSMNCLNSQNMGCFFLSTSDFSAIYGQTKGDGGDREKHSQVYQQNSSDACL